MRENTGEKANKVLFKIGKDKKIGFSILVSFIMLAATTPMVFAATVDTVIITFDPEGDIDIDVNLSEYNFTSVVAGIWSNTTGGTFTLYNNGTIPMDTEIRTNASTDEGDMNLNESDIPPQMDEYAIYIEGLDFQNYLNSSYTIDFDQGLNPSESKTFDICLLLGNISTNHSWQTTTVYFRGSIS
ncbi:hypothetical protein AYK21_04850 [Thermoplasmatales archaeon SG8-52-2]|nr:MAG: hypothetical protein AYK21_04850 [Thermoplasmatales archaeon SG8-52-2]